MTTAVAPLVSLADGGLPAKIGEACARTGFFVVVDHAIDAALAPVFDIAQRFFGQSDDVKQRSAMVGNEGWAGVGSRRGDGKEMYDVSPSPPHWPALAGFREAIERYQAAGLDVAAKLLRGVAVSLEVEPAFFATRMRRPQLYLRLLRYPAGAAGQLLTGGHTDYGAITLLATDGVPGLEVRLLDGTWAPVEAPAGSVVVNLGDMLARWTNDRYVSTPHRVVSTGDERYSVPFFVNPDPQTEVACIPTCVTDEQPCRYEPITAGEFLQARIDGRITLNDDPR